MAEAVVSPVASPGTGKVQDTPEFQEALKQAREEERLKLDAEYRRKQRELEERTNLTAASSEANGTDWFQGWGERHGLPTEAGRELATAIVQHLDGTVIPSRLKPITDNQSLQANAQKRQELRAQRQEVRDSNPRLAKLDAKFHDQVMKLLDPMDPVLIGPESYLRALHMVIGANIESLETGKDEAPTREIAPGPEPTPASGLTKPKTAVLNGKQRQFCEERGFAEGDFVEMMRDRARKLEGQGMTKAAVRLRLGELLGAIEF